MAPRSFNCLTKILSFSAVAGSFAQAMKPKVVSRPSTLKLSLSDIGSPCNGPMGPVLVNAISRAEACARALSKLTSDRQLVYSSALIHDILTS